MAAHPTELSLELKPSQRFDIIDVKNRIGRQFGDFLNQYKKSFYCSFHTTAGYLEQSFCARLNHDKDHVDPFIGAFRKLFPADADYRHDQMELRNELTEEQKVCEPRNGDSHLIFIGSGLNNAVTYQNQPEVPVYFIDLDGVYEDQTRSRKTSVLGYNEEVVVHRKRVAVPMSKHRVDSVNLRDDGLGIKEEINELLHKLGVNKGYVQISLSPEEKNAGVTVNEYETLLMRHDLTEVLKNPIKFMAEQGRSMLKDPRTIPSKTMNYAKYDFVHIFNEIMDAFKVSDSVVEKILAKFIALPASRFLRMKRSINLFVTSQNGDPGQLIHGTYQSPILVQWKNSPGETRYLDIAITEFK